MLNDIAHQGHSDVQRLSQNEYNTIRSMIHTQWLTRITKCHPEHVEKAQELPLEQYHTLLSDEEHKALWPKQYRILPYDAVQVIKAMPFFQLLTTQLRIVSVANEEGIQPEEMYWRLVRPGSKTDVGPLHADRWFWDLGHGQMPPNVYRLKLWLSIANERGQNGLAYVPDSHTRNWRYHGEQRDGFVKPVLDDDVPDSSVQLFLTHPGDYVVFHDDLLHGGKIGGKETRFSLEFTLLCELER